MLNALRLLLFILVSATGLSSHATAQTLPYQMQVDSFTVPERGLFDSFDDGFIDFGWSGRIGNVSESGGTLSLSDPGVGGFLLPGVESASSVVSGMGTGLNGFGDFTATSIWLPVAPTNSQGMNFSIGSVDPVTGHVHQLTIGISRTSQAVADVLGGSAGLTVNQLSVIRDSGPGNILAFERRTMPISEADIEGRIMFSLAFDDALDLMTPSYSLDNGMSTIAPFGSAAWAFYGGGFSLSGSSTVPEPGSALSIGLGLMALGLRRFSTQRDKPESADSQLRVS